MRSKSVGQVRLQHHDPRRHPVLEPNYLSHPDDLVEFRRCIEISREIFAQRAFDEFRGEELAPGADITTDSGVRGFLKPNFVLESSCFRSMTLCARKPLQPTTLHAVVKWVLVPIITLW
jgi:choline dehydrogenase